MYKLQPSSIARIYYLVELDRSADSIPWDLAAQSRIQHIVRPHVRKSYTRAEVKKLHMCIAKIRKLLTRTLEARFPDDGSVVSHCDLETDKHERRDLNKA